MIKILPLILAMMVFLNACNYRSPSDNILQEPNDSTTREFKIIAKAFEFIPETIEVNKGDFVRLIITSIDTAHGYSIPEYGINERINPGEYVTIEFLADKEGIFTSYCSVSCGQNHSKMKGRLIVK